MVKIAPYGTWQSPLTADRVGTAGGEPKWVTTHAGRVYWTESRPAENGRLTLVHQGPDGHPADLLPPPWNVRNRLHEYGGRPFTIIDTPHGPHLVFTDWADQRLHTLPLHTPTATPTPITPPPHRHHGHHGHRYADLTPGPDGTALCVRETVTGDHPTDLTRHLVAVPLDGGPTRELARSHHFMTAPRLSPDGTHLAWIGWNHPDMPWDGTELCLAPTADPTRHTVIAGGPRDAVCQADWETPNTLLALSDPDGWWNLHRIHLDGTHHNLAPTPTELGGPLWTPGARWTAPLGHGRHAILRSGRLAILDEHTATVTDVDTELTWWNADLHVLDGTIVGIAGTPTTHAAVVRLDPATGTHTTLTRPHDPPDPAYLPTPTERTFTSPDGRTVPALLYPPTNPDHTAPPDEKPPYLVHVHGGPTGRARPALDLELAYFTSRGIGVAAVNYGGSAGYGRHYRESLNGQWGIVDVADCAAVATALADEGTADPHRLAIRGGSAGGWTSAASMTSVDTYRCATIMYPVLDMLAWVDQTHDFESRYLDHLVGTLPEHRDRYVERSPINRIHHLAGPVLLLQGLDDEVCPPEQADRFTAALHGTGIPHAYLTFPGEQHGFRKADTIRTALQAELSFYGQILGFHPHDTPVLELRT